MTRYYVDKDAYGDDCLWREVPDRPGHPELVVAKYELGEHQDVLWPVLVGVLAEDDETVEKVANALHKSFCGCDEDKWGSHDGETNEFSDMANAALRALRGEQR